MCAFVFVTSNIIIDFTRLDVTTVTIQEYVSSATDFPFQKKPFSVLHLTKFNWATQL